MRSMALLTLLLSASSVVAQRNHLLPDMPSASPSPKMIDVAKYGVGGDGSVYSDIMSHCDPRGLNRPVTGYSRKTNGHETTHMIQANMRNRHGGRVNAVYLLNGKGVILKEPGIAKRLAQKFIPHSLRASRYDLYVAGQTEWDDRPLYLVDEWNAYIHDCMIGSDDKANGRDDGEKTDAAVGCLEMGIYTVGMAMAVERYDREYWEGEPEFKTFMRYQWRRANGAFGKGAPLFPWDTQDRILNNLRTSPDAEEMRAFIRTHLDGVWLDDN